MNLLPPASMKKMRADFRARFVLAGAAILLACALIYSLALVPAEISVIAFKQPATPASPQAGASFQSDSAALAQTNALLSAIAPFTATSSLGAIQSALADRSAGITFTAMTYSAVQRTLSISGHAATPGDLNAFREALGNDPAFKNVSVPVSALLGSQSGSFTVTMNTTD